MDPQSGSEDPLMILSLEQRILRLYERIPEIMISSTVKCMKIMYSDGNWEINTIYKTSPPLAKVANPII